MMGVIDLAINKFGGSREEWRQVGEAAVHRYATVGEACRFLGPAIIHGGEFRGGTFHGGTFHDGEFYGGWFRASPIQLLGACQWPIVVQGRGDGRIAVGCECHSYDEWMRCGERIAEKDNTQWAPVRDALECVRALIERQQTEEEQC